MITGASNISRDRNRTWPFMFNCVDEEWQHNACAIMGLEFVAGNGLNHGGPHVILKRPRTVLGDGNCLFRSFSYIITGSEEQYRRVREVILNHMVDIGRFILFHHLPPRYTSIEEYIHDTEMDRNFTWGTDVEMLTMAHLLNTCVFVYNTVINNWGVYSAHHVDRSLNEPDNTHVNVHKKSC